MLPRLQAAEQLDRVRAGALAFGGYEKEDARAMLDELHSRALGEHGEVQSHPSTGSGRAAGRVRSASADDLAGMGIGAVMMPPPLPGAAPVEGFAFRVPADPAVLRQAQDERP